MRFANIDDVWPEAPPLSDEEPVRPASLSSRIQTPEVAREMSSVDLYAIDLIVMERMSTLMILMLGCVTGLMLQIDRLRRELRLLRVGAPRPL